MLGFSALSEAPLSQSTAALAALGYLVTTVGNSNAGTLAYQAIANITTPSATASGLANAFGDTDAQATANVVSVLSSFSINDLLDVVGQATVTPSAATATFTTPAYADIDAQAGLTLPTVASSFTNGGVDFDAEANITTTNVLASTNANDFSSVQAQATITPSAAIAASTANDFANVKGKANLTPASIESTLVANDFESVEAKVNATLSSVSAYLTIYLTDFADEDAQATALLPPAVGQTSANISQPTAVVFDYSSIADQYNRQRVSYILGAESNTTVYINKDETSYTVYVTS